MIFQNRGEFQLFVSDMSDTDHSLSLIAAIQIAAKIAVSQTGTLADFRWRSKFAATNVENRLLCHYVIKGPHTLGGFSGAPNMDNRMLLTSPCFSLGSSPIYVFLKERTMLIILILETKQSLLLNNFRCLIL